MKTIKYIGFALAAVMLFAQCGKDNNTPEDKTPGWAHWNTGDKFQGLNNWTEVIVGDIPLVLSAPHGGDIRWDGARDRNLCYTGVSTGTDSHTRELTYEVANRFQETYGVRPYIIINHLHRSKVDQNRDHPNNGGDAFCQGEAEMEEAWYDFHNYIDTALWRAVEKHGYALYIDMHAHGHPIKRLEIGYRLSGNQLTQIQDGLNLRSLEERSSIADAIRMNSQLGFRDLIMGDNAFGTLMEDEGIPSVPSKQDPRPTATEPFFSGGYNTSRYTKHTRHPNVYGFQIEHDSEVRTVANRPGYVEKLVKVLWEEYMPLTKPQ